MEAEAMKMVYGSVRRQTWHHPGSRRVLLPVFPKGTSSTRSRQPSHGGSLATEVADHGAGAPDNLGNKNHSGQNSKLVQQAKRPLSLWSVLRKQQAPFLYK